MLNQIAMDKVFLALAQPHRRSIVEDLCGGPASVSSLAAHHDLTLAAVLQHVQFLEASGLVSTKKSGRVRTCYLESKALESAQNWFASRKLLWERRLDQLDAMLAADKQN